MAFGLSLLFMSAPKKSPAVSLPLTFKGEGTHSPFDNCNTDIKRDEYRI
nr:MAG TPA: hypothetical protein [Caudoviricetes sp.]